MLLLLVQSVSSSRGEGGSYFCCINQEQKRKQRSMGVMVLVLGWLLAV